MVQSAGLMPKKAFENRARHKPLFFWISLLLGAILLGLYVFSAVMISRYGALYRDYGWGVARRHGNWVVASVTPRGPADGKLQIGDVVLDATNDHVLSPKAGSIASRKYSYVVDILRGSSKIRVEMESGTRRDDQRPLRKLALFAVGLVFYLVGLALGLAKPEDSLTRRAALALLAVAVYQLSQTLNSNFYLFTFGERLVYTLIYVGFPFQFALAYRFYYRFPQSAPRGRSWTALEYLLSLWGGLLAIAYGSWYLDCLPQGPAAFLFKGGGLADTNPFILTVTVAICFVIARNYRLVKEPDQHRRIKWVIYGSIVGIVPGVLYTALVWVLSLAIPITDRIVTLLNLSSTVAVFMTVAVPLSIGYAVLKHRAFDIHVVIRRGLQHLFAKQGLQVILALPVAGLAYAIIVNRNLTLTAVLTSNPLLLVLIAAAGLSLKFRRQLVQWIDRRFFREAYSQEQILLNLIEKIKKLDSMPELSRLVSKEVESALHPEHVYVFSRGEEKRDLTLGYSSGGQSGELRIAEDSELLHWMRHQRGAQELSSAHDSLPEESCAWLGKLDVSLIVPMGGDGGRLNGLLLLGQKKSEEPYSKNDRQLLEAITSQMAVVYENVWLKDQALKEQKIKHEVLARFEERQINLVKECPVCGTCYDSTSTVCAKDNCELTLSLPVERTIEEKYRLDQMIGRGGMGAVYEATDLRLNRKVAVKIMLGSMFGDRMALRRFEREAQASARLGHANIITVYDYGSIRTEGAYLVMELVRGPTLRSELSRMGQLDGQTAAAWFTQIFAGVSAAHQAAVIHRDLKPENVLVARGHGGEPDRIKLLDFGLARISQLDPSNQQSLTVPGTVVGTFSYMSPEQVMGEEVDERGDIFALGVMVVEALTGSRPFVGRSAAELMASIVGSAFHLEGEAAEVKRLDDLLQKCLAKDRKQRFASVAAMQQEMIHAIAACPPFAHVSASHAGMQSGDDATRSFVIP